MDISIIVIALLLVVWGFVVIYLVKRRTHPLYIIYVATIIPFYIFAIREFSTYAKLLNSPIILVSSILLLSIMYLVLLVYIAEFVGKNKKKNSREIREGNEKIL